MRKTLGLPLALALALAGLLMFGPMASATNHNCSDYSGPVDVSGGDPNGLDADGDGIGCETNSGPTVTAGGGDSSDDEASVPTTVDSGLGAPTVESGPNVTALGLAGLLLLAGVVLAAYRPQQPRHRA